MEILWWLAPSAVVAVLAMCWVAWLGRDGRGEVDRDVAVARMARALEREQATPDRPPARGRDRSTGVAVRPSRSGSSAQFSAQSSAQSSGQPSRLSAQPSRPGGASVPPGA